MKLGKRFLAISLAASMVATPMMVMAEEVNINNEEEIEIVEREEKGEYTEFKGKIKSVKLEEGKGSILVEGENESIVFHINDKVLVTDMKPTKENKIMNLKEGAKVRVFYPSNTPVALSMPAQLTPEVVVVENGDKQVKLDRFNEDLLSSDGNLVLNIEDKEEAKSYAGKKLLVFYSISTESLPEQTTPELVTILDEKEVEAEVEETGDYKRYEGKILKRNKTEDIDSIKVKIKDEEIVFHISEDTLVTDMKDTRENKSMHLKEDAKVIVFTKSNAPMMASMPPQVNADVIVVENGDRLVKVDKFDENLVSSDNMLKLNIQEDKKKEDFKNEDLLVFYKESTKSIPAQTIPVNIIKLTKEESKEEELDITVLDRVKIDGKEVKMNMYKKSDGTVMIPVRELADAMEYDLKWTDNSEPIELSKGAHWLSLKIGENKYSFAKMAPFELSSAPELKNGKTFVPSDFIEEVLKVENMEIIDGVINIKQ